MYLVIRWLRVEGPHKASGLDLSKPHGAQAEGLYGVGYYEIQRTGLEEGHSFAYMVSILYLCQSQIIFHYECSFSHLSYRHQHERS